MKLVYAYIRVSTQKQGSEGASLPEQRDSIQRFCDRNNLQISKWFEEQESAAARGRPLFGEMMKLLKKGKAEGVVFHKIDRSTRNLSEWAEVSSLPEIGVEVHYSHEPVDLSTNHGRTAADVAAVFASAFIRNLREETKKGIVGRLKQGLYPFNAPTGYLNNGGQKPKSVDPIKGPIIKAIFERYATGEYSFKEILRYANSKNFSGYRETPLSQNGLSKILKNPFYKGIIYIQKYSTFYPGVHEALISNKLFDQVQKALSGKVVPRKARSIYLFQKMLRCQICNYNMIGETHRGLVYYRCHHCKGVCVRESELIESVTNSLKNIELSKAEIALLRSDILKICGTDSHQQKAIARSINLQLDSIESRLRKLTDAYLEQDISKSDYEERKGKLISDRMAREIEKEAISGKENGLEQKLAKYIEQLISLKDEYFLGNLTKKRIILKSITSNMSVFEKKLCIIWAEPFKTLLFRGGSHNGGRTANPNCKTAIDSLQAVYQNPAKILKDKNCIKVDYKRSSLKLVAEVIYKRVIEGAEYIYPDFDPSNPFAPLNISSKKVNESWRENFKRKSVI